MHHSLEYLSGGNKVLRSEPETSHVRLQVENLEALPDELRKEGVTVVGAVEGYEYGKFGWVLDPEGNKKKELWKQLMRNCSRNQVKL